MSDQDGWHLVGTTGEITEDEPKQVKIGDVLVGLFRVGDEILAIHDVCTHEFACLTDGWVEGDTVECPLHQARFNLRTGEVLDPPATDDVATYPVKLDGDQIYVSLG